MAGTLDLAAIELLLALPDTDVKKSDKRLGVDRTGKCSECGIEKTDAYCRNPLCKVDPITLTYPCDACGHCSTPNQCVASIVCPVCDSSTGSLCMDSRGGLTGYHEVRWLVVKERFGTYYNER